MTTISYVKEIDDKYNSSMLYERKIESAIEGLSPVYLRYLSKILKDNALNIANYISYMKTEINLSDHYRKDVIKLLCIFSSFFSNGCFRICRVT